MILTRDVQNRIGVLRAVFQDLNGLLGWYNNEFDFTLPGFSLDLLHNRQSATASPNDQPVTFPGNLLLDGQRSVTKVVTKFFGWLLIPLANLSSIDDHVVLVRHTVDADRAKRKSVENHRGNRTLGSFVITMMCAHNEVSDSAEANQEVTDGAYLLDHLLGDGLVLGFLYFLPKDSGFWRGCKQSDNHGGGLEPSKTVPGDRLGRSWAESQARQSDCQN